MGPSVGSARSTKPRIYFKRGHWRAVWTKDTPPAWTTYALNFIWARNEYLDL